MVKSIHRTTLLILIALVFSGCALSPAPKNLNDNALRVGITPDYPPMIFKLNNEIKGAEADLAIRLGKALERPVRFVELSWEEQIPALMQGRIDIIMSGMTITDARKARIDFTDPYLKSGLVCLMRVEDTSNFNSLTSIQGSFSTVGVIQGTTGEAYVRRNFSNAANIIAFQKASDAPFLLKNRRIDLFVDDAPSVVWLASENEGMLKGFWEPLNEEHFGWGVRRDDPQLLMKVNLILKNWKKDGTLREVLTRWLPYWKHLD